MISSNGILVLEVKYLLESYFEDDFAIVFEGGICRRGPWNSVKISESNCKLVDKKGYELVSGCSLDKQNRKLTHLPFRKW